MKIASLLAMLVAVLSISLVCPLSHATPTDSATVLNPPAEAHTVGTEPSETKKASILPDSVAVTDEDRKVHSLTDATFKVEATVYCKLTDKVEETRYLEDGTIKTFIKKYNVVIFGLPGTTTPTTLKIDDLALWKSIPSGYPKITVYYWIVDGAAQNDDEVPIKIDTISLCKKEVAEK